MLLPHTAVTTSDVDTAVAADAVVGVNFVIQPDGFRHKMALRATLDIGEVKTAVGADLRINVDHISAILGGAFKPYHIRLFLSQSTLFLHPFGRLVHVLTGSAGRLAG